ncbi:MAG: type II toxin-antitoxin system Phd/YefM family antitoxin [Planctomycetes bacterium]|jgi:prevent-host-death family protein|nr:type II toxin-antitoxin system Phd/YefM family antitoxin [Planctomycetota bacterium]
MDTARDIEPVTALKERTSELVRRVAKTGNPIVITVKGRPGAVLQDVASWQRQRTTLLLLKAVVQGDADFRAGRSLSHEAAIERLRGRLEEIGEGG